MLRMSSLNCCVLSIAILASLYPPALPCYAEEAPALAATEGTLAPGDVRVRIVPVGSTKYVTGTVMIDAPAKQVWQVVANPREFESKICPEIKHMDVLIDEPTLCRVKVTIDFFLLPRLTYVADSEYVGNRQIDFRRVSGAFRDFNGSWTLHPVADGSNTELTYKMFIDPGMPIPQWLIRQLVKGEFRRILLRLRERVEAICNATEQPLPNAVLAARCGQ